MRVWYAGEPLHFAALGHIRIGGVPVTKQLLRRAL